ncbi:PQQ-binding-like beta-propeller repeat protein [Micromonospora sp. NPDC000089]|uniref:outer membrane protein assembly factor BamB family protein n=1 Tax=unclassified Micromonospora TaxID=2617518 RepID=UPI0036794052
MTLIDLGDVTDGAEPAPADRRPPPSVGRPLRALLVGLLALLALAAAAPAPSGPTLLFSRDDSAAVGYSLGDSYLLGDLFVVVEGGEGPLRVRGLTAVGLADERPRWRWTPPDGGQLRRMEPRGDGLLVSTGAEGGGEETVLLDAADGRVRWRVPGTVSLPSGDVLLLESVRSDSVTVRAVDGATGAIRWTASTGAGAVGYGTAGDTVTAVVLVTRAGRAEVRDPHTGAVRTTLPVPPARDGQETARVAGDLLLVDEAPDRLAGYDLVTGARRWRVPSEQTERMFAGPCADAICLYGIGGSRVLDPATGRPRWPSDVWQPLRMQGDRMLAVRVDPGDERLGLLDPATGRVILDLAGWQLGGSPDDGATLQLTRPVSAGRLLLAELGTDGEVRPRDLLPERAEGCGGRDRLLVCWQRSGGLRVWRLPG